MISFSANNPITIVVADDLELMISGIQRLLEKETSMKIIATANNGDDAIDLISYYKPMVAIIDILMPGKNGIEIVKYMKENLPEIITILLTSLEDESYFSDALEAGADGYLAKDISSNELISAIKKAILGERVFSKNFLKFFNDSDDGKKRKLYSKKKITYFTSRERDIIRLFLAGKKNKEMAQELNISIRTIESHRLNIMRKLGVINASELDRILKLII
jgi:DNA-binding NarL/FixJ family response regulator